MCQESAKLDYTICTIISSLWNLQYECALAVPFHKHVISNCVLVPLHCHIYASCASNLFVQNSQYFKFMLHSGALSHCYWQPICTELALRFHSILVLTSLIFMERIALTTAKAFGILVTKIKPQTIKKP